jgi:RIO kinase 1
MPREPLFPPGWLVPAESHEHLGILKTGKESEVHLVARTGGGRTVLVAEKRFLARDRRLFQDNYLYRGVWGEGTKREHRAMKNNTRFGHEAAHARWIAGEWESLVRLDAAGVTVPPPVELLDDGYRMAFIGDADRAAPRLSEVALDAQMAARVWRELLDEIAAVVAADRVHGDLSAYNVLWWRERAVIIDLSQCVDVVTHPAALQLLERDLRSLGAYFARRGVRVDLDGALAQVGGDARRFARQVS